MRLLLAWLFLMLAVAFLLMLNGQTFTNGLFGIVCAVLALALGALPARDKQVARTKPWAGRIVAVLAGLLALGLLGQLPSAYRFQRGFNRAREQVRQMAARGPMQQPPDRPKVEVTHETAGANHVSVQP